MKTRVRLFTLLLVFSLLLGLAPITAMAATGGYKEQELPLPDGYVSYTAPVANPGGGYVSAAKRGDTGTWDLLTFATLTDAPQALPLEAVPGEIESISMAPDGQLMALVSDIPMMKTDTPQPPEGDGSTQQSSQGSASSAQQEPQGESKANASVGQAVGNQSFFKGDGMKSTVVWYDQSGKATAQFPVEGILFASAALSDRRLAALQLNSGVTVYDASGKVLSTIPQNDIISLAASADGLYLMKRSEIAQLDAEFNTVRSIPLTSDYTSQMMASPDGRLYVLTTEGIFSAGAQDTELTKKSDVTRFLLGAPDNGLSGACALDDGTIIARFGGGGMTISSGGRTASVKVGRGGPDEEEAKMVAYLYDAAIDTSSTTDFTISALRDSDVMRKVVNDFQRAHPELTVHFDPFLSRDDTDTPIDDAIRTLNTNLLAGKAGDVILLDELPIEQYISKGVLAPLDNVLKDIGFLPGILSGSQAKDGHIYAMPAQFSFETLWGAKDKIDGISTLDDLIRLPLDNAQELMHPRTPEELLKLFYPAAQASFVDENGKIQFDSPAFASFLETLYQIYSNESAAPDAPSDMPIRKMGINPEEMQGMLNNAIAVVPAQIGDTMQAALPYTVAGAENSLCIPMPSPSGAGDYYVPSLLAGINAQTKQRGFAEEFLRLLYSPAVQELDQVGGLPTVTASLDTLINKAKELSKNKNVTMMVSTGTGNPIQMKQPDEAAWDRLRAMCDTLKTPYIADAQLMSFMVEETASFFNGQGTAQDAARAIAERAGAYLNER